MGKNISIETVLFVIVHFLVSLHFTLERKTDNNRLNYTINMEAKLPNRIFVVLFVCTIVSSVTAQEVSPSDTTKMKTVMVKHSSGYKTTSLRLGGGIGYGIYRDMGTAPMSFNGVMLEPVVGLEFGGMRRWITTVDAFNSVGVFEDAVAPKLNFGSFDISNTLRFKMQRYFSSLWAPWTVDEGLGKFHFGNEDEDANSEKRHYAAFYASFGAANFFDVTVNPEYENAAAGISEFIGPEFSVMAIFYLNSIFGNNNIDIAELQLHTELGLMPVAAVLRPGFAYIDNYTASQPVISALFDNYEWHLKPFAGLYTDIGLDIMTGPFNCISLSYYWSYHSSGNGGASRFDHATHYFAIDFIIPLKTKRVCVSKIISAD